MDDQNSEIVSVMLSNDNGLQLKNIIMHQSKSAYCEIFVGTHYVDRRWKVNNKVNNKVNKGSNASINHPGAY